MYEGKKGVRVELMGSMEHPTIPFLSASPDGYFKEENVGLEIKCPSIAKYVQYRCEITDNVTMGAVMPQYYYQMQAQMMCCGFAGVDFVPYCEFLSDPIHIVRILPDADAFALIEDRVKKANEMIAEMTKIKG